MSTASSSPPASAKSRRRTGRSQRGPGRGAAAAGECSRPAGRRHPRRASDAFRLGFAILVVAVSIPVMRANSAAELAIVHALNPPPPAISWLVTALFWLGSAGVVAGLAVLALLVPRLAAVRRIAVAGLRPGPPARARRGPRARRGQAGPGAGRGKHQLSGGALAVTIAVARTALPYLRRALHRLVSFLDRGRGPRRRRGGRGTSGQRRVQHGHRLGHRRGAAPGPGSPLGLPSAAEVAGGIADLGVRLTGVVRAPRQAWGLEKFTGQDGTGGTVELSVYGRDATEPGCWPSSGDLLLP